MKMFACSQAAHSSNEKKRKLLCNSNGFGLIKFNSDQSLAIDKKIICVTKQKIYIKSLEMISFSIFGENSQTLFRT